MSGKILVTGATGKVGSEIAKQLVAKGVAVKIAAHHPAKAEAEFGNSVEIVAFDYDNPQLVEEAFEGVEKVFVMSPPYTPRAAEMEIKVVDAAKKAGVKYIVDLSAAGVENNDETPLRVVEKYIEASGIPYTHLRPTWFSQNFSTGQAESIKQGAFYVPADNGKTGFVDVRDIAAVGVAAFTEEGHANKAYTITGGEALDHYQVAELISQAIGKEVKYVPITDEQFRATTTAEHWPTETIETLSWLYGTVRQGWSAIVTPTVQEVVGRPPISFAQFAQDHAEVWK